ncbi:NYN domain-containing protein [Sphingobium algorifonticola]|uniref:NYN domain-containing protein n=1 Tax=Sphingobium algorifonticola TaxID=2008318 RepID=A0A437J861_9SPHN|nr:NYN domain-containing protein [Sphingobium algorifonticola]RVT41697.1 NYN domain-containing protein [Sphingobium algorifonticola]
MSTAIVVDGAFFLRRFRSSFPSLDSNDPKDIAWGLTYLAGWHIALKRRAELPDETLEPNTFRPQETSHLYRVFFYDCAPLTKKVHRPVSKRSLDLSKTETALFRIAVHEHLKTVRKVALRLGRLNDDFIWRPKPEAMKKWLLDTANFVPDDTDFELDVVQKGVDMRLGLDVASMAFKRQVDQIILVAADADFVPAVKLARREGIDVVLDTMGGHAAHDLVSHVDGVRNCRFAGQKKEAE